MQTFNFKYQNNKGAVFLIIGVFIAPMLLIFPSVLLLDVIEWIFWITVPLMLTLMVWSIYKFAKVSRSEDSITIDDQGFTSKDYGRVLYSDIESIPPYNMLQAPPPSMRIKLNSGRKIVWMFNPQNTRSKESIASFTAFRELLLIQFMQMASNGNAATSPSASNRSASSDHLWHDPAIPQHYKQPVEQIQAVNNPPITDQAAHREEIITQLYQHKKRDYKYVTIPIAAVIGILFFIKTCGVDFIQSKREKDMKVFRSAVMGLETKYQDNIEQARVAIDHYAKQLGAVYLFTNDPEAKLKYLPILEPSSQILKDVVGLRRVEENKKLEKLIAHPDSAEYQMVIHHLGSKDFIALKRSPLHDPSNNDSSRAILYLALYDPSHSLFDSTLIPGDPDFRPVQFSSSISFSTSGKLQKKDLKNMNYAAIRSLLLRYKDARFYMATSGRDRITARQFEKIKEFIGMDFREHGLTTDNFLVKTFNER